MRGVWSDWYGVLVVFYDRSYSTFEGLCVDTSSRLFAPYTRTEAFSAAAAARPWFKARHTLGDRDGDGDAEWTTVGVVKLEKFEDYRANVEKVELTEPQKTAARWLYDSMEWQRVEDDTHVWSEPKWKPALYPQQAQVLKRLAMRDSRIEVREVKGEPTLFRIAMPIRKRPK